jgi:hypothetical protein
LVVQLDTVTPIVSISGRCVIHGVPGTLRPVWILRCSARGGVPVFHCTLDPSSSNRLLEIPRWMFEASIVCLIHFLPSLVTSGEALRELKGLIAPDD